MTDIQHSSITGSDAIHPNDYYQNADPGAVGPGKSWKDTNTVPPIMKRRNTGDTGWDVILDPSTFQTKSLLTTLGDLPYASGSSIWARLAGNTAATRKFLRELGDGVNAAAPAWDTLVAGDIPNHDASKITTGTFASSFIPNLDASKITTGLLSAARLAGHDVNYYAGHIFGGGGINIYYMLGANNNTGGSGSAVVANTVYAVPFVLPRGATIDRIGFSVTTLLAGNGRVGIYDATSDTNIYPNSLIIDGGSISTSTTGLKEATVSQVLTPGKLYWAVYVGDAAASVRCHSSGNISNILGVDSTISNGGNKCLSGTLTFGALPGTFPGSIGTSVGVAPITYVRISA